MSTVQEIDFLVVGAGPIGSALALLLSKISEDISVVLVDQNPKQNLKQNSEQSLETAQADNDNVKFDSFDTKVFAINSGSRQLLEELNVWAGISQNRVCSYKRMHVWDSEGTGSVSFSAEELINNSEPANELGFIVEARQIQHALDQRIHETANIQVYRPAQIKDINWLDEHTSVELDSGEVLLATMICAADGARSTLREKAAIQVAEDDCNQRALVANIQLSKPHENCAWQIFRPTGPLAFLPLQSDCQTQCSIVWSLDTDEALRIEKLDGIEFTTELERAIENRFGELKLNSDVISFSLSQRHALDYGVPGMVLVGDAAHSIHPLAGLGANLGFQDVVSLSKEFSRAQKRGISFRHESVINRYQRQRRVDNELTLKAMKFFKDTFADHGVVINGLRNLGLKVFSSLKPLKKIVTDRALMSK